MNPFHCPAFVPVWIPFCASAMACVGPELLEHDSTARVAESVVGGVAASPSDYPSTVAITDLSGDPFCSGTLVGAAAVVTAAHCLDGRTVDDTRVVYGYAQPSHAPASERRIPSLVTTHPQYRPTAPQDAYGLGVTNDVGAVLLQEPIPDAIVAPILPLQAMDQELVPGRPMHIVGFGVNNNATQESGVLYRAITPLVRRAPNELLAGLPGQPDTCYGDSGGPAYIVSNGTLWLAGATSRAWAGAVEACGESTIYTAIPYYADWLSGLGADLDGGVTEGGFEGGGWPAGQDASDAAMLDVASSCLIPGSACDPRTNEGCDTSSGQACRLDEKSSSVACVDGPNLVPPGGMCDQTSRFCMPGYHCGPTIKCEKLCCTDVDCPPGIECEWLGTLLGDLGSCGVVLADASSLDAEDALSDALVDAGSDAAEDHAEDASEADAEQEVDAAGSGDGSGPSGDYPGDPIDPGNGCNCRTSSSGGHGHALAMAAALLVGASMLRRRRTCRVAC